jgi:hypothetical protein
MDSKGDLLDSDGRYGRSDGEDDPEPTTKDPYWPWLLLIGFTALDVGVFVALIIEWLAN